MFGKFHQKTKYRLLHDGSAEVGGEGEGASSPGVTYREKGLWLLLLLSLIFNGTTWYLITEDGQWSICDSRSCQPAIRPPLLGHSTEMLVAREAIELETVKFSGGFVFKPDEDTVLNLPTSQPRYVGPPSSEIDSAWEELLLGEYLVFNESEAISSRMTGNTMHYTTAKQGMIYFNVIDIMHELHCVNEIRKYIDKDHYEDADASEKLKKINRVHTEHCLDYIRQVLMCHSDLTPVPALWDDETKRPQPQFEQVHTCRNFDKIRAWAISRRRDTVLDTLDIPERDSR